MCLVRAGQVLAGTSGRPACSACCSAPWGLHLQHEGCMAPSPICVLAFSGDFSERYFSIPVFRTGGCKMIHVWHTQAIPEGVKTNTALQLSGVLLSLPPFFKTYIFSPWFAIYLVFFWRKKKSFNSNTFSG